MPRHVAACRGSEMPMQDIEHDPEPPLPVTYGGLRLARYRLSFSLAMCILEEHVFNEREETSDAVCCHGTQVCKMVSFKSWSG